MSTPTTTNKDSAAASVTARENDNSMHSALGNSSRRAGMESSVLKWKNVNFVAGKGKNEKHILRDVSNKVTWGHTLAIMGPSGAGKSTLIRALTLDANYGTLSGSITLNGVPLTESIFKKHCYVVEQYDNHWPLLTCRETLMFAARSFEVADASALPEIVDDIIHKMGLDVCADVRCSGLSGGQKRRLSIGMALLKQPTVLFLDEPTTGLDAASSENIMREIVRVAKDERLIIVCTIHTPSTKVYNGFDQVMVMSRGREVYAGDAKDAVSYFDSIGFPCPEDTNPAEFMLDLANSDFSDEAAVEHLLDTWEEHKPGSGNSTHHGKRGWDDDDDTQVGVSDGVKTSFITEMGIMLHRHALLIARDPVLYFGRCAAGLVLNIFFAFVYWKSRVYEQDQVLNKLWINIWFCAVVTNMAVVAVYALNAEFKSVLREAKNGMIRGTTYVIAKNVLTLPFIMLLSIACLGIPAFVIMDVPGEAAQLYFFLFAALMFVFESAAEFFSVLFEDPIMGMLQCINFWFASFLFGGFVIPEEDLYYPWTIFYHIMPFSYYVRSTIYETLTPSTFETCEVGSASAICIQEETPGAGVPGDQIVEAFERVMPIADANSNTVRDMLILIAIGMVYKILYIVFVIRRTRQVTKIQPENAGLYKKSTNTGAKSSTTTTNTTAAANKSSTNSNTTKPPMTSVETRSRAAEPMETPSEIMTDHWV